MKYLIEGEQRFTSDGKFGIGLFLVSPIVGALCWVWYLSTLERFSRTGSALPAILMGASAVTFLVGFVLILIGRTVRYTAAPAPVRPEISEPVGGLWQK